MAGLTEQFLKDNITDPDTISIKFVNAFCEEYVVLQKDVRFIEKYGVIMPLPTRLKPLQDQFVDSVLDAIFHKFRGLNLCLHNALLSELTKIPIHRIRVMMNERLDGKELEGFYIGDPSLFYYVNPYAKDEV